MLIGCRRWEKTRRPRKVGTSRRMERVPSRKQKPGFQFLLCQELKETWRRLLLKSGLEGFFGKNAGWVGLGDTVETVKDTLSDQGDRGGEEFGREEEETP